MESKENKPKVFVLDTNVLLHSAQSVESFQDNDVVIPMAVVEELDKFKKNSDELGRNARQVIRYLDRLRQKALPKTGQLRLGVPLSSISASATGKLFVLTATTGQDTPVARKVDATFGSELAYSSPDNRILRVAYDLKRKGRRVIFISKDINLRIKADALGIAVMDFERGKVNSSSLYTGFRAAEIPASEIDKLYREHHLPARPFGLLPIEFLVATAEGNPKQSVIARCRAELAL